MKLRGCSRWRRLRALGGAVVVTIALLGGCGTRGQDAVAWADGLCSSWTTFVDAVIAAPEPSADPVVQRERLAGFLGSASQALAQGLTRLDALGPAPVDGGEEAVTRLRDRLTRFHDAVTRAHDQIAALDPAAPGLDEQLAAAVAPVAALQQADEAPLAGLDGPLTRAINEAPSCQDVRRHTS